MKVNIPETVLKKMASALDGRRFDDVEVEVEKGRLAITMSGGRPIIWTREDWDASRRVPVSRSLV